ncbi:MAG: hypothetical protein ABI743_01105 [bacterium]
MTELVLNPTSVQTAGRSGTRVLHGLMRREWLAHRSLLQRLLLLYFLSPLLGPLLPLAIQLPNVVMEKMSGGGGYNWDWATGMDFVDMQRSAGWVWAYWMGMILALVLGMIGGGAETSAGLEEGTLALPPTRQQRYRARLRFHAAILGAHFGLATLLILIHQYLLVRWDYASGWGLYWFFGVMGAVWLVFITTFTAAANGGPGRRPMLFLLGIALPILALQLQGVSYGAVMQPSLGSVYLGLIVAASVLITWAGERIYCTREVHALVDPA